MLFFFTAVNGKNLADAENKEKCLTGRDGIWEKRHEQE